MRFCKNSLGFTLIEALMALSFLSIVAALVPLFINSLDHAEDTETADPMEVELFFQEIGLEIRESTDITTVYPPRVLYLEKYDGRRVSYERYGWSIRRQVDDQGHQVVLQKIRRFDCQLVGDGVKISIEGRKGETYERIFLPLAASP